MARSGMTPSGIMSLLASGKCKTQNDVAKHYGVSRQAVSLMMKRYGIEMATPRKVVSQHYPWNTGEKFHDTYENRVMRDHGEYMATGGKGMQPWKLERLRIFYQYLQDEDVVVEFDPNLPPSSLRYDDRYRTIGGFAFRKRKESDGDLIIRVNEHTNLTEEGKRIWRMPPKLP